MCLLAAVIERVSTGCRRPRDGEADGGQEAAAPLIDGKTELPGEVEGLAVEMAADGADVQRREGALQRRERPGWRAHVLEQNHAAVGLADSRHLPQGGAGIGNGAEGQ